ncbi:MAG: type III-A CRISPR-associated protein Cas10/Csm1, partial [Prevotellaceae bacterium]|nr:type III-A CRISPR-associated protein Cas10/Csm1 [Prevotellaceae bacterium]
MEKAKGIIREHLYLAALLHDIGKFYQRASNGLSEQNNNLSGISKNLSDMICPLNQSGYYGYQHTVWTTEFLCKHEATFKRVLGVTNIYEQNDEYSLVRLSAYHHRPDSELTALISMADWWSAGIDRQIPKDEDKEQADAISWGNDRYRKIPLYSIFNSIDNGNTKVAFPLTPLDVTDKGFPKEIKDEKDGENQAAYKKLWDAFEAEFNNLPQDSFNGFAESLLYLLKKYTWCIPSSTVDMANVSLFEHLKTTAAFANCLYLYKEENRNGFSFDSTTKRLKLENNVCPVLLLGGDLSGIQKFIYNIASRKAAVSLKGRSFYLQLLIDSVIQRIITHADINVNVGNTVYSSGGKFYMLLPNTGKVKRAIAELKSEF